LVIVSWSSAIMLIGTFVIDSARFVAVTMISWIGSASGGRRAGVRRDGAAGQKGCQGKR
jgi:hypothetical protein